MFFSYSILRLKMLPRHRHGSQTLDDASAISNMKTIVDHSNKLKKSSSVKANERWWCWCLSPSAMSSWIMQLNSLHSVELVRRSKCGRINSRSLLSPQNWAHTSRSLWWVVKWWRSRGFDTLGLDKDERYGCFPGCRLWPNNQSKSDRSTC